MFWPRGMQNLSSPSQGLNPLPLVLEGKVLTTRPPGKFCFFDSRAASLLALRELWPMSSPGQHPGGPGHRCHCIAGKQIPFPSLTGLLTPSCVTL